MWWLSDDPSFALGLGVGLVYLMSAGKSEISRLHTAMDETTKVVQELKTEIAKRKSSHNDVLSLRAEGNADPKQRQAFSTSTHQIKHWKTDDIRLSGFPVSNDGECGSSVLTEEPQSEVLMDQLEVELESELQKLPWCTTEASGPERCSDFFEVCFVQYVYSWYALLHLNLCVLCTLTHTFLPILDRVMFAYSLFFSLDTK